MTQLHNGECIELLMEADPWVGPDHTVPPSREHNASGSSGAAFERRQRQKMGTARGTTNPYVKDVKCAEKQLRQKERMGAPASILAQAKNKVENFMARANLWAEQREENKASGMDVGPSSVRTTKDIVGEPS